MTDKTITLRSDLVERLEAIAKQQQRSLDEAFGELLSSYAPVQRNNWALIVAEGMEQANIDWLDDPDAATTSREHFQRHLREKWERTQKPNVSDEDV
ncbi:MAG: hypothetical protein KF716_04080 [Anaerolineae bacterium]|nr:hypothetical protein [Anaerolineae bacterium]